MKSSNYRDVSTVVSILPYPLMETKPGLIPERWKLAAVKDGEFRLMPVERCHHPVYIDENRPRLIVPDPSDIVAQSIVFDHKTAMVGYAVGEAEPGLGWVPGEYADDEDGKRAFLLLHQEVLDEIRRLQRGWFEHLMSIADDDWARYRQHKFITDLQRTAARTLGLTNRDWLLSYKIEESLSKCRFCFAQIHPLACICPSCTGILDMERYKREFLGTAQVEVVRAAAAEADKKVTTTT